MWTAALPKADEAHSEFFYLDTSLNALKGQFFGRTIPGYFEDLPETLTGGGVTALLKKMAQIFLLRDYLIDPAASKVYRLVSDRVRDEVRKFYDTCSSAYKPKKDTKG
jgi:hypothetical protein